MAASWAEAMPFEGTIPAAWPGQAAQGVEPVDSLLLTDTRVVLLVTTVDLGDGSAATIEVREGDDPLQVAAGFCTRHGLPDAVAAPLAAHLEDHLDAAKPPPGAAAQVGLQARLRGATVR